MLIRSARLISVVGIMLLASATLFAAERTSERVTLPTNVKPDHYDVELTPEAAHLAFRGKVSIQLQVTQPTSTIVLNATDLTFDKATLSGRAEAPKITLQGPAQTATFTFTQPLAPGRYTFSLAYHGKIYQQAFGLFALDYAGTGGGTRRALFTQFENSDARRVVPSWDEPGIKSTFALTVTVPSADMPVSNMPVEKSVDAGNGLRTVRFERTPKMSVYLLFFASGDFERIHKRVGETDVGIVVKRGDAARAQFALDTAVQVLPYYNEYFGMQYPLPKLDIVGAPGSSQFFSAMENWGAILHFERALLVDPRLSTEAEKQGIYSVIAHEMAHQWFGDLVTMAWWDDLWLNEGFASWMQNKASERFHPEWKRWLQSLGRVQSTMQTDAGKGTHPIITPIRDVLEAGNAFDDITYTKGQAVIRMLEAYVGEDAFRAGVRNYMQAFAYGNTVTDDLWHHIDAVSPKKITGIAHDFTLQAGVPLISVDGGRCTGGRQTVALSQQRFALDESGKSGAQTWRVPVAVKTLGTGAVASAMVSAKAPGSVTLSDCKPAIANAGQTGYFRTRYSPAPFAALVASFEQLAPDDQVGLLENTAALAFIGQIPMADFLNLTKKLPVSADTVVWSTLTASVAGLDRFYDDLPAQRTFRGHLVKLLQPVFATLGWDAKPEEPANAELLRADLLAVLGRAGDPAVLAEARKRFAQLLDKPNSVSAAARKSALGIVSQHADEATWDKLRALAKAAPTELERQDYYLMLGRAADATLAQRALDFALTDEAPVTLRAAIIRIVANRHPERATDFVVAHWAATEPLLGDTGATRFVPGIAQGSSDLKLLERLETFRRAHVPANASGEFEKAAARIHYNALVRSRLPEVDRWLVAAAGQ